MDGALASVRISVKEKHDDMLMLSHDVDTLTSLLQSLSHDRQELQRQIDAIKFENGETI